MRGRVKAVEIPTRVNDRDNVILPCEEHGVAGGESVGRGGQSRYSDEQGYLQFFHDFEWWKLLKEAEADQFVRIFIWRT